MTTQQYELIPHNTLIHVPAEIAVCPYCGGALSLTLEEWELGDDGQWQAGMAMDMECEEEPDMEDRQVWRGWCDEHIFMPYVYWLPVEMKVREWINSKYRFLMDND